MSAAAPRRARLARTMRAQLGPIAIAAVPGLFLALYFVYPVLRLLAQSVEGGSLAPLEKALTDGLYLAVLWETIRIALIVTLISALIGYPLAYWLATTRGVWATLGFVCLLLPFWTAVLVRTYAWMILLGRNGLINRALDALGLVSEPVPLLYNTTGVVIGMVHVLLPYMVFPIYAAMRRVDATLLLAAEGLGAPRFERFRRVYFPLTLPGVFAGAVLVFTISLGFFITPALLGGGRVVTIGVLIEQQVRQFVDWPFAAALSLVLLAAALAVRAVFHRALKGDLRWN
jgi:ABC-type spermidine/putrescine transport system permease subunit I